MKSICIWVILFLGVNANAQEDPYPVILSDQLKEISGLELIGDSLLVAHNDGGSEPCLYLLDLDGNQQKKVFVTGGDNEDWEDLAIDSTYLYIGDIGNNRNERRSVNILKVPIRSLLDKDTVKAEQITVRYAEQFEFPPAKSEMRFDAEGLVAYDDSLLLFTKDRSFPMDGMAWVYKIPKTPGEYRVEKKYRIYIGKAGFWKDAITAADVFEDTFYIMTYDRILVRTLKNGVFTGDKEIRFRKLKQREAIVVKQEGDIFVGSEGQVLLGQQEIDRIGNGGN